MDYWGGGDGALVGDKETGGQLAGGPASISDQKKDQFVANKEGGRPSDARW